MKIPNGITSQSTIWFFIGPEQVPEGLQQRHPPQYTFVSPGLPKSHTRPVTRDA